MEGDLLLRGGEESISRDWKFSNIAAFEDLDSDLFDLVFVLDLDFLLDVGEVGCLGGGKLLLLIDVGP